MSVYRPRYHPKVKDLETGKLVCSPEWVESKIWWYDFTFAGKRYQGSTKQTLKTLAVEFEKSERRGIERAYAGLPTEQPAQRIRSVRELTADYLKHYPDNHRSKSVTFAKQRLAHVERILGGTLLPDLNENRIRDYIHDRLTEGVCGRTINMELGELSRAIGNEWSVLWPKVRKLEERKDMGRALSPEEEGKLLGALPRAGSMHSPVIGFFVRESLSTGMRSGELLGLTWRQVDFRTHTITVGKAKTSSGTGRQIPINPELEAVLAQHVEWFTERFGEPRPEWYLFPYGKRWPQDPARPTTSLKTAWNKLRTAAGVSCRLHDLRHTTATKMAENGTPESTMLALLGHMSRAMLERYSHIRMQAKRDAMGGVKLSNVITLPKESPKETPKRRLKVVSK